MKGLLPLNMFVDVPTELFPFDESVKIAYVVGWYFGNSYRVLRYFSNYPGAVEYSENSSHECVIHKLYVTLQKLL